jgi:hypothetical protein
VPGFIGSPAFPRPATGQPSCERILTPGARTVKREELESGTLEAPGPWELLEREKMPDTEGISADGRPTVVVRETYRCGAAATDESGETLCWHHRNTDDMRAFGTGRPANLEEIKRRHRIPAGARASIIHVPGEMFDVPRRWRKNYVRVQMFTLPCEPGVSPIPLGFRWAYDPLPRIDRPGIVARWRLRHVGKPGILEMTWDYRARDLDWRTRHLPPEDKENRDRLITLLCPEPTVRRGRAKGWRKGTALTQVQARQLLDAMR